MQLSLLDKHKVFIQKNKFSTEYEEVSIDILRLDQIDPVISGNKFFKLQLPIDQAMKGGFDTIASFGGAYSNHIVATACYCNKLGLKSVGVIRGEQPANINGTLLQASAFGMELHYVSREDFKQKEKIKDGFKDYGYYWVNEGGYSRLGAEGAKDICHWIDGSYTDIVCAIGTGTMMAGLIAGAMAHQKVTGICVLKGYADAINDIKYLLSEKEQLKNYAVIHDYHFGGYAKHPKELLDWMNSFYREHTIPTDIVYTSKVFYAVDDLLKKRYFNAGSKIMVVHSGGLQGNSSLAANRLIF